MPKIQSIRVYQKRGLKKVITVDIHGLSDWD